MSAHLPILEVSDAAFAYEGSSTFVLDGVDLAVEEGACVCLMGMNGCGKSTLIDCMLSEHRLARGRITLGGRRIEEMSARERARLASYVPQVHERTFPYTVRQVVSMGLTAKQGGFSAERLDAEDAAAVKEALRMCGIERYADRPYTMLSGGEMQMVLLARALVQDAPLMLMDEPTAHLDFRNELLFLETVERLVRERGCAVLMATHSPNQAFHLDAAGVPTQVALMREGRVGRFGPPNEVLDAQALEEVFGVRGIVQQVDAAGWPPMRQVVAFRTV